MKNVQTVARWFRVGRWVLMAHATVIVGLLALGVSLGIRETVTGPRLRFPEPADTILVAIVTALWVSVILLDSLLALFIDRLGCQMHHDGFGRRVTRLFAIFIPIWGLCVYEKFRARSLQSLALSNSSSITRCRVLRTLRLSTLATLLATEWLSCWRLNGIADR
jgi:hypothetical protein